MKAESALRFSQSAAFSDCQTSVVDPLQKEVVNVIMEEDLFNGRILRELSIYSSDFIIRPLRTTDYDKDFIPLLGQLTEVGAVDKEQFLRTFRSMKASGGYYIVALEDPKCGRIIGCATLVVELKFIRNCARRGRIEDVVVADEYRGKQLGKLLIKVLVQMASYLNCYKLSLECKDQLIPFYESLGFKREPGNANSLNMRFQRGAIEQSHL